MMNQSKDPSHSCLEKNFEGNFHDVFPSSCQIDNARTDNGEDWLLTYTDLVTLLITLFIVMVAHARYDEITGNTGQFEHASPIPQIFPEQPSGTMDDGKPYTEAKTEYNEIRLNPEDVEDIKRKERASQLKEAVIRAGLADSVDVEVVKNTIEVRINEKVLFPSAKAELFKKGQSVLDGLVTSLVESGSFVSVEGHTDNVPISNGRYATNWELSAARALSVIHFLEAHGVPKERLQAVALADTQPIAGNDTEDGRQKNRRVQIVLK